MSAIELTIIPREKSLGGFSVSRVLPSLERRMVGPFIFLDHMGPADFAPHDGIDVRPHPHIGLATVTYLFEGEILHRDTIGSEQIIKPSAVNWMVAGKGIAHSERTVEPERSRMHRAHGMQSWIALPKEYEECEPEFSHHAAEHLPDFTLGGANIRLIAGSAYGYESPVRAYSPMFYAAVTMQQGNKIELTNQYRERALYMIDGDLQIGSARVNKKSMLVFEAGERIFVEAQSASTFMILGGDPLSEQRYIDWNFVSSSKDRIVQAREDWQNQRFGKIPGDDKEFIPLP